MDFDFAAFLVFLTLVTGVIWLFDGLFLAPKRHQLASGSGGQAPGAEQGKESDSGGETQSASEYREPIIVEYAKSFFPVILIVLLLRSFLVEPFRIPSGSMLPTLLVGDFILVNKHAYGVRLPVLNIKVLEMGEPQRGDVVVFRYPDNPSIDYIKRVVGLPGDEIEYRNKIDYVNGKPQPQSPDGVYEDAGTSLSMSGANKLVESLGTVEHDILHRGIPSMDGHWKVPAGHYFMMGDNRDNSSDSRRWGFVPEANLVGEAFFVWMSWDSDKTGILDKVRFGRLGKVF